MPQIVLVEKSDELASRIVPDLWDLPEFRRYCRPFEPERDGQGVPLEFVLENAKRVVGAAGHEVLLDQVVHHGDAVKRRLDRALFDGREGVFDKATAYMREAIELAEELVEAGAQLPPTEERLFAAAFLARLARCLRAFEAVSMAGLANEAMAFTRLACDLAIEFAYVIAAPSKRIAAYQAFEDIYVWKAAKHITLLHGARDGTDARSNLRDVHRLYAGAWPLGTPVETTDRLRK